MIDSNALGQESSLYLQQHAGNPVWWQPWGEAALQEANSSGKPILLSIGYSACHWCHVMEHECFEHEDVAQAMNEHFVCIKLDREERPDIDMVYMAAVQAMGVRGGWPLNVFLLPTGEPFYGGTYYPKQVWLRLLSDIGAAWANRREDIEKAAYQVRDGIGQEMMPRLSSDSAWPDLSAPVERLARHFDQEHGGMDGAPKFPTPVLYAFLLDYAVTQKLPDIEAFIRMTLDRMVVGGMYDVLGGGFCRYSVDAYWFVPHFEKMLYDNGQLLSLYSEAARYLGQDFYRTIAAEIIQNLKEVFLSESGLFYSALDADSDGREGGYYTFGLTDVPEMYRKASARFFGFTEDGNWDEDHTNIPVDVHLLEGQGTFREHPEAFDAREVLLKIRSRRSLPGLDRKRIVCWNALTISGLCDYYLAAKEDGILAMAIRCAEGIERLAISEGRLLHQAGFDKPIPAFLDDYAALGNAYLKLLYTTGDETWYGKAFQLGREMLTLFPTMETGLLPYVSRVGERLIVEKAEVYDSVIPSANSMAFEFLSHIAELSEDDVIHSAAGTLERFAASMAGQELRYSANWARVLHRLQSQYFIVATGPGTETIMTEVDKALRSTPSRWLSAEKDSTIPYLSKKIRPGQTLIYVCREKKCLHPFQDAGNALEAIRSW